MADRLSGKVAIVTGASSAAPGWGNGKATAVRFAREGARVLCVDRSGGSRDTAEFIVGEGGEAQAFQADVTVADQVRDMVERCVSTWGRIDVLHNNVGVDHVGGPVETSEQSWDEVLRTNLTSQFLTCKYTLPIMERQGAGVIINMSSIAGIRWVGAPSISYASSKAAIIQFTQTVALEYAPKGIRANTIVLGVVRTPTLERWVDTVSDDPQQVWRHLDESTPRGRIGDAWDTAGAAVFLASDESAYITGTTLVVDGGLSATMRV
ncbi:MAG TPA: SDR family oxidoreductase [Mycobacterium sp.]|nr:SDR family oxidoreductase [Mycobacterium sp.]